jgi:hypothetical protein
MAARGNDSINFLRLKKLDDADAAIRRKQRVSASCLSPPVGAGWRES